MAQLFSEHKGMIVVSQLIPKSGLNTGISHFFSCNSSPKPVMLSCKSTHEGKEFRDWMGLRMGNGISPCFLEVENDRPLLNPI